MGNSIRHIKSAFSILLFTCICQSSFGQIEINDSSKYFMGMFDAETDKNGFIEFSTLKIYQPEDSTLFHLTILSCRDSSFHGTHYRSIDSCLYKIRVDPDKHYFIHATNEGEYNDYQAKEIPDSLAMTNHDCVELFYQNAPDAIWVDTLYLENEDFFSYYDYVLKTCQYHYTKPHGTEVGYYTLEQVGPDCIGDNDFIWYTGQWNEGRKTGEWTFYYPNGNLMHKEYWKKDKLKSCIGENCP